jgi:hypothetical protein
MSELGVDSPTLAQGSANGSLGVTGNVAFANPGAAPTEGAIETLPDDYITGNRPPPPAPAQSPAASNSDPGGYAVPLPWLEQQIVLHPNRTAAVITAAALAAALGGWVAAGGLGSSAAGGAGGGILVRTAIVAGAAGTGAGPQRTEEAFEEAGTYVYQLVDEGGEAVYYGISNDPARRLAEHALEATKPFNGMQVISQGQPLAQAQALETSLIQQASAEGRLIYNVAPQSISPMLPIQTPSTIVPSVTLLNPALYPR